MHGAEAIPRAGFEGGVAEGGVAEELQLHHVPSADDHAIAGVDRLPTNLSFTNVQMNWTAPGAKEWAQKQIGEAKETFFFTASDIVANFTKAVVLQGDEVIGAPIDRNQDGQVSGANSAHVCTLKEGSTEGMDREELPVTFDGLKKLLNEEEVGVSENVGSKATLEGTRHAKEVLTYLGKAEGSTEGIDLEAVDNKLNGVGITYALTYASIKNKIVKVTIVGNLELSASESITKKKSSRTRNIKKTRFRRTLQKHRKRKSSRSPPSFIASSISTDVYDQTTISSLSTGSDRTSNLKRNLSVSKNKSRK